jgi:ATP-dependent helicase YprA (DUF1998 family)
MKEWQFKLFHSAINKDLLYKEEFDELLNVKESTNLEELVIDKHTEFDFIKVPIFSWGKRIKKLQDTNFKRLKYKKKLKFNDSHDLEIERLLNEIGTKWIKMPLLSSTLQLFDRKQIKQRARTIKKKRIRENIDIGIFKLID